jgi:quercetin dioxygenase-like cupin family protein
MEIHEAGSAATRRAPTEYFSGTVWQEPIIDAPAPARVRAVRVTFEPGARTPWHAHPLGQVLHVMSGVGYVQAWGEPIRKITPGDTVWIAPNEKHWHGAAPNNGMVHLAWQEHVDGNHVTTMEKLSDEDYAEITKQG